MAPNRSSVSPDPVQAMDNVEISTGSTRASSDPARARSVNDFETDEGLMEALHDKTKFLSVSNKASSLQNPPTPPRMQESDDDDASQEEETLDGALDWVTTNLHKDTSHSQSLQGELNRLKVLRSYLILDADREASFERLTGIASRMFKVPICLVSLVDLGRQWFMSNRGLGDVRETPRKLAFCAHTILSKHDLLIVNDATADDRFCDSPLVLGPPHIRFYGGAPLISPEGYKLGTLCLIDTKTRPGGLCLDEKQNLRELAALVVDSMVERRRNKLMAVEKQSNLIRSAAHDIMTPLNGVQLSLNVLMEEQQLSPSQKELVETASSCANVMSRICHQTMDSYRGGTFSTKDDENGNHGPREVEIAKMVKNLQMVMETYPKSVPLFVTLDPSVPATIISDDLKIFRSAVNLLTNACDKTKQGSVHLRLYVNKSKNSLVFECADTGPGVSVEIYPHLFQPFQDDSRRDYEAASACIKLDPTSKQLRGGVCRATLPKGSSGFGLYSVANNIGSLDGDYGFRPQEERSGAVFWFSVPLVISKREHEPMHQVSPLSSEADTTPEEVPQKQSPITSPPAQVNNSTDERPRVRRALVIDDSAVIRKSVSRALSRLGLNVTQAINGMEGLQELKSSVFDVVLCDFLMPVLDGLDCVQQYRSWEEIHRPWFHQYVVGISAHAGASDVKMGMNAGMDDFLSKPVTLKALKELEESDKLSSVRQLLDNAANNVGTSVVVRSDEEQLSHVNKKQKQESTKPQGAVCLIADDSPALSEAIKQHGWDACVGSDGKEALRLLKMRQWDAVFLSDDMPLLNGLRCMGLFRQWENENRVSRQGNVFMMSGNYIPSLTTTSCAMYPKGFDGAVGKPVRLSDLHDILQSRTPAKHEIIVR